MWKISLILYLLLSFWAGLVAGQPTGTPVDVRADLLEGDVVNGETIQRLIGNVDVRQGTTRLTSQRAVRYFDRNEILFTGRVRIIDEGDTLTANEVQYFTRTRLGEARGNVRLSDGQIRAFSREGSYDVERKVALFPAGVRLEDSVTVVTSPFGRYETEAKVADFWGRVELAEPNARIEADSVRYDRERRQAILVGNVRMDRREVDDLDRPRAHVWLFGDSLFNDEPAGWASVHGNPLLIRVEMDSVGAATDTLMLRAQSLQVVRRDSLTQSIAVGEVLLWSPQMASRADSVWVEQVGPDTARVESARLFGAPPVVWVEESQVVADSLTMVRWKSVERDTLRALGSAFVVEPDSATQRLHQLKADTILVMAGPDSLRFIRAFPAAEVLRWLFTAENEPDGAVVLSGDEVQLWLRGERVERARVVRGIQGTQYAEDALPETLSLQGVRYEPERRPSRSDVLLQIPFPAVLLPPSRHDP